MLESQSDNPLDKVREKFQDFTQYFETQLQEAKEEVESAERTYVSMCSYLAVDMGNEEAREVLPMLLLFLNDFNKVVERVEAGAKRPLKANELQMKIRMKRQEARDSLNK